MWEGPDLLRSTQEDTQIFEDLGVVGGCAPEILNLEFLKEMS